MDNQAYDNLLERRDELQSDLNSFEISEHVSYEQYDEMLDECSDEVVIGNLTFSPSNVLKECDPIAYREGYQDYINSFDESDFDEYTDLADQLADVEAEIEELEEHEEI